MATTPALAKMLPDDQDEILPCPRCHRLAPAGELKLWRERLRLRTFTDGSFKYVHKDRYFAVCPSCFERLSRGGAITDFHERRGIALLAGAIVLAIVAAGLTPYVLPTLASALWQTH